MLRVIYASCVYLSRWEEYNTHLHEKKKPTTYFYNSIEFSYCHADKLVLYSRAMLHYARKGRYIPASLNCGGVDSVWSEKKKNWWKQSILSWSCEWAPGYFGNSLAQYTAATCKKEMTPQYCMHHGFNLMQTAPHILATLSIGMEDAASEPGCPILLPATSWHPRRTADSTPQALPHTTPIAAAQGDATLPCWHETKGDTAEALHTHSLAQVPAPHLSNARLNRGQQWPRAGPRRSPAPRTDSFLQSTVEHTLQNMKMK